MRFMRVLMGSVAAAGVLAGAQASFAGAVETLTFRLQLAGGGFTSSAQTGDVKHLEIWADIVGTPQTGAYNLGGSFISNSSATNKGDFSNPALKPLFAGNGSQLGTGADADGDGDLDWGSANPGDSTSVFFYGRTSRTLSNVPVPVVGSSLFIGTIDFSVTNIAPGQTITLSFLPRDRAGLADQIWTDGYVSDANPGTGRDDTTSLVFAGSQVTLTAPVPEPASLGLLAMGAVGLLARRKR